MSFPNPWDAPDFYQRVIIGGRPVKANLVEIDGISVEDDWTVQRPLGSSGATNVFKGTKPAGPCKLTFEAVSAEEFDDLRELYELMRPKPGQGAAGQGATTGSPGSAAYGKGYVNQSSNSNPAPTVTADDLLKSAQAALKQLQAGGPAAASPTAAGPIASILSPGPKPPTLSIENGYLNYHGITAISRKSWDGPKPTPTNSFRVVVEVVLQKAPIKAAVGAASTQSAPAKGKTVGVLGAPGFTATGGAGGSGDASGPAASSQQFNKAAAAAGAGT